MLVAAKLTNTNAMKKNLTITAPLILLLCGCASILDGGDKSVRIGSNPLGAKVTVFDKKGKEVCVQTTPAIVTLPRARGFFAGEKYRLVFEKDGYFAGEACVESTLDGWYIGNIFFGGILGLLIIDPATGACYTLSPRDIDLNLIAFDPSLNPEQIKAAQVKANLGPVFAPARYGKGYDRH